MLKQTPKEYSQLYKEQENNTERSGICSCKAPTLMAHLFPVKKNLFSLDFVVFPYCFKSSRCTIACSQLLLIANSLHSVWADPLYSTCIESLKNSEKGLVPCMGSIQHTYTFFLEEILPKYLIIIPIR